MGVKVEIEGKDLVIRFPLEDKYFEVLDDRLEGHTSLRLTISEKYQVIFEIFRQNIEHILADWSWYLVDSNTREVAEDVIAESGYP